MRDTLVADLESVLAGLGLEAERISLASPAARTAAPGPMAAISAWLAGCPGAYAVFVGGDFEGTRLSSSCSNGCRGRIGARLAPLLAAFAVERRPGEGFGDFCHRIGPDGPWRSCRPRAA